MGVDYTIKIKRKCDDKVIAEMFANDLKSILDSEFSDIIHCDGREYTKNSRFTVKELDNVSEAAFEKINQKYSEIIEKKLMIMGAANRDIKSELEEDIRYIKEDIDELRYVITSANSLIGKISCMTEDLIINEKSAYERNGEDLPKEEREYMNGDKYEYSPNIWNDDVYCEIEANW